MVASPSPGQPPHLPRQSQFLPSTYNTRFFADATEARRAYATMRAGLADLLDRIEAADDTDEERQLRAATAAIGDFVRRFP